MSYDSVSPQEPAWPINAGVILSQLRAEIAAFSRAKDVTIFFASMAHLFPEHTS